MNYYLRQQTLLEALDNQNHEIIRRCLKAGQCLDVPLVGNRAKYETILLHACDDILESRVISLLAYKDHLDINYVDRYGLNALFYAGSLDIFILLIQAGIDVDRKSIGGTTPLCKWQGFQRAALLLSAGANPENAPIYCLVKEQVKKWLIGLECAKLLLKEMFESKELERIICEFVFNEQNLWLALECEDTDF